MTTVTAIAIKECITPEQYPQVVIPFLIANGKHCSMYAATLDENGDPRIQRVGYPGKNEEAFRRDVSDWMGIERKKLVIAFAMFLNKFKSFYTSHAAVDHKAKVEARKDDMKDKKPFSPSSPSTKLSGNKRNDERDNDGLPPLNRSTTRSN
jgi:hypothetical protein